MRYKFFIVGLPVFMAVLMTFIGVQVLAHVPEVPRTVEETPLEVKALNLSELTLKYREMFSTGTVEAADSILVSSEVSGVMQSMPVELGQWVQKGELLAQFDDSAMSAQLKQAAASVERAKANYDLVKSGATSQQIAQAAAGVGQAEAILSQAQASYEQSKLQLQANINAAELAVEAAELNVEQDPVQDAHESHVLAMQGMYINLRDALYDADAILGVTDKTVNDDFERGLGTMDENALNSSLRNYDRAYESILVHADEIQDLDLRDDEDEIEDAEDELEDAIEDMQALYEDLKDVLDGTVSFDGLPQTQLDGFRSSVAGNLAAINGYETSLNASKQGMSAAEDLEENYAIALENAELNLDHAQDSYKDALDGARAVVDQAKSGVYAAEAAYEATLVGPRNVDLAPYLAGIKEATAAYEMLYAQYKKTQVRAPFSGRISEVQNDAGEFVGAGQALFTLVNDDALEVNASFTAKDAEWIEEGMDVVVNERFEGSVIAIAPSLGASKKVEVRIALESTGLTPGEIVQVELKAEKEQSEFLLPLEAVKTSSTGALVYSIEDGVVVEIPVTIGELSGEQIKVLAGISKKDLILSSTRGVELGQTVTLKK